MTRSYRTEGLSKEVMMKINSEVLRQFWRKGFKIDEGVAVDARLASSSESSSSES